MVTAALIAATLFILGLLSHATKVIVTKTFPAWGSALARSVARLADHLTGNEHDYLGELEAILAEDPAPESMGVDFALGVLPQAALEGFTHLSQRSAFLRSEFAQQLLIDAVIVAAASTLVVSFGPGGSGLMRLIAFALSVAAVWLSFRGLQLAERRNATAASEAPEPHADPNTEDEQSDGHRHQ